MRMLLLNFLTLKESSFTIVFCLEMTLKVRNVTKVHLPNRSLVMENRKMLTRIFPTDDRMVVVIDDRSDVWPNCPNLLQVPAYKFFVGTGDIHNPAGMKANQLSSEALDSQAGVQQHITATVINTDDKELVNVQKVNVCCQFCVVSDSFFKTLERIHSEFYAQYKATPDMLPDVKIILPSLKQTIFGGLRFVFSGLLSHQTGVEE